VHERYLNEDRSITIGMDASGRILVVVFTLRRNKARIIPARKATARERLIDGTGI
jgi:uncharacterized protein